MYERKGNNRRFIVSERSLCDSHTKLSGTVPLENWRTCVAVHTLKGGNTQLKERKHGSDNLRHLR